MNDPLCQFIEPVKRTGKVEVKSPELKKKLYFPLFNQAGLMSAVTHDFKGDLKRSQNEFHLHPMITEDLYNCLYSRNFWVVPKNGKPWSVTGVSAEYALKKAQHQLDDTVLTTQPGVVEISKQNKALGISATYTAFIPANQDTVEILIFTIKNNNQTEFSFNAVPAIPIYARSADNQRDHRQVTTMLNRIYEIEGGLSVKPIMSFDERGHKENAVNYAVMSFEESGNKSAKLYQRLQDFIGDSGSLEAPAAIYQKFDPPQNISTDGREAIAAFEFANITLKPNESKSFIVLNAITEHDASLKTWAQKYRTLTQVQKELELTKTYWQNLIHNIHIESSDTDFDNWFVWVTFQPMARKVFGCSFLPDFGYGRGGRGWRDLWQDCLALILTVPNETTELLYQNFAGIRADGSNATIIGRNPGEFIADRNNITRTWMDHGVWPLITLNLYMNQTGDMDFLLKKQTYFKDLQAHRSQKKDLSWNQEYGNKLKTTQGKIYEGTILEHLLIQNITQFYNVGEHNICKLEGADWNDGLDMAHHRGESVAFHSMYMHNLNLLADYLMTLKEKKGLTKISILKEAAILFDTINNPIDYSQISQKQTRLTEYMQSVIHQISGEQIELDTEKLANDLRKKALSMKQEVLNHEWLRTKSGDSFFNGYYNNDGKQVEGDHPKGLRMTLTGQVFPIMSGLANDDQIEKMYVSLQKYLKDPVLGGYHLNTNFGEMALNLGRAFSFSYGDKENGAFFSHMIVMLMYALYSRGHVQKGYEVFQSIYKMCMNTKINQIIPHLPEYFDADGRGAYLYLTGSASWMVLTILTQIFGVTSVWGDLVLAPKLVKEQFKKETVTVESLFNGQKIQIRYHNPNQLDYGRYQIKKVLLNETQAQGIYYQKAEVVIPKKILTDSKVTMIDVYLDETEDIHDLRIVNERKEEPISSWDAFKKIF